MATSAVTELQTDFIKCPVCLETFRSPKYLPCLHTFCEGCISTYITSTFENPSAQKEVGISCPICRHFVPVPTDIDSKEWVSLLPDNHDASSLLDFIKATDKSSRCSACERENKSESATSWCVNCCETLCEKCVGDHRKFKMYASHEIMTVENLEHDRSAALRKHYAFCQTHKEEKIKANCTDHSAVCCMSCFMLSHRKCENVLPIEEAANAKRKSPEYSELEKCLSDTASKVGNLLMEKQKGLNEFHESVTRAKNAVKDARRRLDTLLDKLQSDYLENISQIERETLLDLEKQRTEIQWKQSVLQNDVNILKISAPAPDALFLLELDKVLKHKKDLQTFVKDCHSKSGTWKIVFVEDAKVQQFETEFSSFGKVSIDEGNIGKTTVTTATHSRINYGNPREYPGMAIAPRRRVVRK